MKLNNRVKAGIAIITILSLSLFLTLYLYRFKLIYLPISSYCVAVVGIFLVGELHRYLGSKYLRFLECFTLIYFTFYFIIAPTYVYFTRIEELFMYLVITFIALLVSFIVFFKSLKYIISEKRVRILLLTSLLVFVSYPFYIPSLRYYYYKINGKIVENQFEINYRNLDATLADLGDSQLICEINNPFSNKCEFVYGSVSELISTVPQGIFGGDYYEVTCRYGCPK